MNHAMAVGAQRYHVKPMFIFVALVMIVLSLLSAILAGLSQDTWQFPLFHSPQNCLVRPPLLLCCVALYPFWIIAHPLLLALSCLGGAASFPSSFAHLGPPPIIPGALFASSVLVGKHSHTIREIIKRFYFMAPSACLEALLGKPLLRLRLLPCSWLAPTILTFAPCPPRSQPILTKGIELLNLAASRASSEALLEKALFFFLLPFHPFLFGFTVANSDTCLALALPARKSIMPPRERGQQLDLAAPATFLAPVPKKPLPLFHCPFSIQKKHPQQLPLLSRSGLPKVLPVFKYSPILDSWQLTAT